MLMLQCNQACNRVHVKCMKDKASCFGRHYHLCIAAHVKQGKKFQTNHISLQVIWSSFIHHIQIMFKNFDLYIIQGCELSRIELESHTWTLFLTLSM